MALTQADKRWLRLAIREIVADLLDETPQEHSQAGGYDGAVPTFDDPAVEDVPHERRPRRRGRRLVIGGFAPLTRSRTRGN